MGEEASGVLRFLFQRIPDSPQVADQKQYEQKQVVGDHTGPGRDQIKAQKLSTQKRTRDPHHPHTDNIVDKRSLCSADTH